MSTSFSLLFRLALRNTTRKPLRTTLTAGMVVAGTSLLVLAMSWIDGVFDEMLDEGVAHTGHVRVVAKEFAEREALMPLHANLPQVEPILQTVRATPGVTDAWPRISTGVTVTVGEEIGDVFGLMTGAPKGWFTQRLHADSKLAEGRWFEEGKEELVMGATVVRQVGAKLGDEIILLGVTQDGSMSPLKGTLVGIVKAGSSALDRGIFVDLPRAQWMVDVPEGALEVLAYGINRESGPTLAASLAASPTLAPFAVQSWTVREPWASMMGMIGIIRGVMVFVVVFLAGLGVWNTMMMSVLERTREIGVLRAMGMTRGGAISLFVGEALAIAVVGGAVGVGLGAIPAWWLSIHGLKLSEKLTSGASASMPMVSEFHAHLSAETMLTGFALGLAMAVIGSAIPAWRAAWIKPVTAMRDVR